MDFLTLLPFIVLGAALGAAAAWFAARAGADRRTAAALATLKDQHAEALRRAEADLAGARADVRNAGERADRAEGELRALRTRHEADREKLAALEREHETLSGRLQTEFENLSTRILEQNAKKFAEQSQANLAGVLDPLKVRIGEFQEQVKAAYDTELREKASLRTEILKLSESNTKLNQQALDLVSALKGDNKTAGDWGEVVLERILEISGIEEGRMFVAQETVQDDSGRTLRPDVVIHLPDGKHLVVDSKVSLASYHDWVSADSDEQRERASRAFAASVRTHVKGLHERNYPGAKGMNSPDFVLMFMPVEPAFALLTRHDAELYQFAYEKKVVIVSPTTLLATLSMVNNVWRMEDRNRNAEKIAEEAGKLLDKLAGFVEKFDRVGAQLKTLQGTYDDAEKRLRSGTGNVLKRADDIRKMGVSTKSGKLLAASTGSEEDGEDSLD